MTPDELLRERKRRELLARANQAAPAVASGDEALVSENAKQSLKAAGHWAGVFGKRAVEATKQGATIAADKAKLAAAAASEKARETQAAMAAKRLAAQEAKATKPSTDAPAIVEPLKTTPLVVAAEAMNGNGVAEIPPVVEPSAAPMEGGGGDNMTGALERGSSAAPEAVAAPSWEPEPTIEPATAPLSEDPLGELPPLPDDAYSEEATQPGREDEKAPARRRWLVGWVALGVVGVGLAAFAWLGRDKANESPMPASTSPVEVPASSPAIVPLDSAGETTAPIEPAPDAPVLVQPEANQSAVVEAALPPEPDQPVPPPAQPVTPPPLAPPASAAPRAAPAPEMRPVQRRVTRPAAKAPTEDTQWQRQADADLDAWAKRAGLD